MAVSISKKITSYQVVDVTDNAQAQEPGQFIPDADRRLVLEKVPAPVASSLRWAHRPVNPEGNDARTYEVQGPEHKFWVSIGHVQNGHAYPFEVWAMGEAPRGLAALAKSISMDMRSRDRGFLKAKLDSLMGCRGKAFDMVMPDGVTRQMGSEVAAFAKLVDFRCEELGSYEQGEDHPLLDALMSKKEPKTTSQGSMAWYVDIANPATADDFTMFVKEVALPDGQRRPLSVWVSGNYPESFDGLCKALSFDMRVIEVQWVVLKLRQLLSYAEPQGAMRAQVPGKEKSTMYPSTVAYMAALVLHRLEALGLTQEGEGKVVAIDGTKEPQAVPKGLACESCGAYAVKVDGGCATCQDCGFSHCG